MHCTYVLVGSNPTLGSCLFIYPPDPIAQFGQSVSLMNRRSWVRAPLGSHLPCWLNWIERKTSNLKVVGSSPTRGTQVQYCLTKY